MTPLERLLITIVSSVLCLGIGIVIGGFKKVSSETCVERRQGCNKIVLEKLAHLETMLKDHIQYHKDR